MLLLPVGVTTIPTARGHWAAEWARIRLWD
jgi:hypothetical protein